MCDTGHVVEFHKHACHIRNQQGNILLTRNRLGNIYKLVWKNNSPNPVCMIAKNDQNWLWHQRQNHLNFKIINDNCTKDLVTGIPKIKFNKDKICSACQMGKQIISTFKNKGNIQSDRCLELLHMDLFGPIPVTSLGGMRYTLVVIDDYSRFTWVVVLNSKDQTCNNLINLVKRLQNEKTLNVIKIRSDRGT